MKKSILATTLALSLSLGINPFASAEAQTDQEVMKKNILLCITGSSLNLMILSMKQDDDERIMKILRSGYCKFYNGSPDDLTQVSSYERNIGGHDQTVIRVLTRGSMQTLSTIEFLYDNFKNN